MTKYWLSGVATFAMMTGAALAQSQSLSSQSTVTTQTTTVPAPAPVVVDTVHTTKTQNTVDGDGVQIDKRQTYTSGRNGTAATDDSQTKGPDGRPLTTTHQERVVTPNGDTATSNQTTTTLPPR
jgi:hypothetical protein